MDPNYLHVLLEYAWRASFVPFSSIATLAAMKAWGGFNLQLGFAMATLGLVLGYTANWLLGRFLLRQYKSGKFSISPEWYARVAHIFIKYLFFILLFSWFGFFNLISVAAAFLGCRWFMVVPLSAFGHAAYVYWQTFGHL